MQRIPDYVKLVENTLAQQNFDQSPKELYAPMGYILALGGKRLRPALSLAACELFGTEASKALMPALGIEVFHNFSLVHDDIMDEADLRRGQATVHKKWNRDIAILSGDAMLVKAYQYIAQVEASILPAVLDCFSQTALEICEGQQRDMNFENREAVAEAEYLLMIRQKTAVLLGAALKIGALVAGAEMKAAHSLYEFGINAGLSFQVQDDLLDAYGDPDKVGKTAGGDILQDKKTLLMIYARELDPEGWSDLRNAQLEGNEKVSAYREWMIACGAKAKAETKRDTLLKDALEALEAAHAPDEELKNELAQFAQWLSHRDR
ncbi:polyprenyl synthetase family protein [Croceimicrobium hydrocarbonivorans]|uniref:Polyprenyl synthetase family protein n=1 Tax=Croceimicrobium hydrocarbonivorans TaxID=2761580 RepID=A0A7H0VIC9_9FLAO|nr:polyprenyl synthetase family protein [Croceimicrobium hydrocarbonivorans]QNR25477.1 polyprenyl synthetase family protein [Croceimicrobium hydrocarbonivorans]